MTFAVSSPWVAYVGPFPYPSGAAASRRVLGVAQSLVMGGFDVVIASGAGEGGDAQPTLTEQEPGIRWCRLPERVAEHWPRPLRRARYAWMGSRTIEWLDAQATRPSAVILYSGYTPYLLHLLPWCRRNGVRLIFDAVEWYEPETRLGYLTSPYQWNIEWAMRRLIPQTDGVIAISSYLAAYYRRRGLPLVTIPPTTSAIAPGPWRSDARLRLCYAGNPSYKDELGAVLKAVAQVARQGAPVHLTVAGPEPAQVLGMLGEASGGLPAWLQTVGLLAHSEVQRLVGSVDFSILARRSCRMSNAGFPTKFVESFASGTPVIANLTSDLHLHLLDGKTGLVCAGPGVSEIASTLERALKLGEAGLRAMRQACLAHAQAAFHPAHHAAAVRSLVDQVRDRSRRAGSATLQTERSC